MLGSPHSASAPSQKATTSTISGMSPKQLFKILTELKAQMQADPEKGRKVLRENLPLTKALFQAQILLGMVNPDQPAMGHQNPPPQAAAQAPPAYGGVVKEEGAPQAMGASPVDAAAAREAALADVAPTQRGVQFATLQHASAILTFSFSYDWKICKGSPETKHPRKWCLLVVLALCLLQLLYMHFHFPAQATMLCVLQLISACLF